MRGFVGNSWCAVMVDDVVGRSGGIGVRVDER